MSKLSNAKTFGGIGALLMLIGLFISTFGVIFIIGLILVFIAIKYIADETNDHKIFDNFLYFFVCHIIIVGVFVGFAIFSLSTIDITNITQIAENITDFSSFWAEFGTLITGCLLSLVIAWILTIIGALFLRKSFNGITEHTKVDMFKTTALVYLIGAATLIIIIGALILLIALILEIVAFFSLPDNLPTKTAEAPPTVEAPQ